MSTPFEFFRRHQKVALAAVTGSAILSFVVFDVNNANNISPLALSSLVIGCLALVGWIWGAGEGKSGENAIFGAVLGLAISLMFMYLSRPPVEIATNAGNISGNDVTEMSKKRAIANRMVSLVYFGANPEPGFMAQFMLERYLFDFRSGDMTNDLLIAELLNRDADTLGIQVTDEAVMNFLKEVAGKDKDGDDKLTKSVFNDAIKAIRQQFQGVSENTVFNSLRHEMRARQALGVLYGGDRTTPLDVWDLHRKINTRQSAQLVELPVSEFVDKTSEPSEPELKAFFDEYKKNYPNFTEKGQLEEGRPGLFLPRRVQLAYIEPIYEELEKQVGEITEEEIQKRYEEQYQRQMPADSVHGELNLPDMPVLPNVPQAPENQAPAEQVPAQESPAATDPPAESPATDKPTETPPAEEKPAAETPAEQPTKEQPEGEKPAEVPAEPSAPETKPEAPPTEPKPEGTSSRPLRRHLQDVVLIQEQDPVAEKPSETEKPAETTPAAEKSAEPAASETPPPADKPAGEAPADKPASGESVEKPATEAPPAEAPPAEKPADKPDDSPAPMPEGGKPTEAPLTVPPVEDAAGKENATGAENMDDDPPPPVSAVRPLDEPLRQQIRDELLAEKTRPLIEAKMKSAREFLDDLHLQVVEYLDQQKKKAAGEPIESTGKALSPEDATKQLKDYAQQHGLIFTETPLLSLNDLAQSEDYPVGVALGAGQRPVVQNIMSTRTDDLYSVGMADDFVRHTSYVYWKVKDIAAHEPANLDEPDVKEAAVKAWRSLKARDKVIKRSQELADLVSKSGKPIAEALAEQTVTGDKENSVFVTVKSTGEFSWMRRSFTPNQFGGDSAPTLGAIQGVEKAGDNFMAKVFDGMKPGETAVVPNEDRSSYYIVQIEKRTPSTDSEIEVMRKQFLESQGALTGYASNYVRNRSGSVGDRLFEKHGVEIFGMINGRRPEE